MIFHKLANIIKRRRYPGWLPHVFIGLVYLFFTFYYMGPSLTNCSDTVYGFGDNTAGPIWRYTVSPDNPLWSYQNVTNYPVGENLYSPVHFSGALQYTLFWGLAKIAGPVCGYNIVNVLGFITSSLVMYGFIFVITRRRWIAFLAGYAVSFSPYFQMKVGGHPSYGYQALLIGVVWAFYNLIKNPRKLNAFFLALITAACFYFDPYFSLFATVSLLALFVAWSTLGIVQVQKHLLKKAELLLMLRSILLSALFTLVLLLPLLFITVTKSHEITSSVAAVRGNVFFEAKACSNLPHEYLLPFALHPIFSRLLGQQEYPDLINELHGGFDCGIGEDTVGVSLTVLTVSFTGLVVLGWEILNKRRVKFTLTYNKKFLFLGIIAIGLTGFIMALPPVSIAKLPTPSYTLLMITSTWRTLARFYLLVNFAAVALFALVLAFIQSHFNNRRKWLIVAYCLLFLAIFVEYQAFRPFSGNKLSTFSYSEDVPKAYTWLRDEGSINEVVEYPLERAGSESNAMAYYLSMQTIHQKRLLNANNPISKEENLRASLKDISDKQTLAVLYAIGIDAVIIHGVEEQDVRKIPELEVVFVAEQSPFSILSYTPLVKKDTIVIARILSQDPVEKMLMLSEGFVRNTNIIRSSIDWEYEALNQSLLKISALPGGNLNNTANTSKQCFSIRMAGDSDTAQLQISVDGRLLRPQELSSDYQRIRVDVKDSILLSNSKGFNMRVKDLGCTKGEI